MSLTFLIAAVLIAAFYVPVKAVIVHLFAGLLDRRRAKQYPDVPMLAEVLGLAREERGLFGVRWLKPQFALRLAGVPVADVMIPENWPKLLLPGLRKIWHTRMRSREDTFMADQIYNKDTSQRAFEEYQGVGEVGSDGWNEFEKLRRVPYGGFDPGFPVQIRHKTFAKGLMVERELLEDNLYPDAGIPRSLNQRVEKLADSAAVFREKAGASVFVNAFTDSGLDAAGFSVAGPDGVGLVSTAHPLSPSNAAVQSNEFTLALNSANLSTVKGAMRKWTDDKGDLISVNPDTLMVPPELEDTARTLVESDGLIGGNNNDINPHKGRWNVEVWPYLTDSNAWFTVDSVLRDEHLIWLDRVLPEFQAVEDFDTIIAKYRCYQRFSYGWDTWQWIAGSNPS